jgi:hypothetical protein
MKKRGSVEGLDPRPFTIPDSIGHSNTFSSGNGLNWRVSNVATVAPEFDRVNSASAGRSCRNIPGFYNRLCDKKAAPPDSVRLRVRIAIAHL